MDADIRVHDWQIAEREYARHESRRGRRHAFTALDPAATALVVIDMVPFFLDASAYCRGIVANINAVAARLRRAGGCVAWVLPAPRHRFPARAQEFFGPEIAETYRLSGGEGALRERLGAGLDHRDGDVFVEKAGPSAFLPGASDLPALLATRGIDTVLIAGTVTNVCCESSARDASGTGFRTIMLADGCAARTDAEHNATLHTFYRSFGDVRSCAEAVDLLRTG
jgi:nicotinamidase-related amidase